ncbi:MAG: DegT/DnrJ/EryC1/StrS family aminotransferase, partial [Phycisphaerae bacterium]
VFGLKAIGLQRMDEILVPPFMCWAVLAALDRAAFPAMALSARTKAILVFHQFGFPQRLDVIEKHAAARGLFILNDAAHTLFSSWEGRRIVTWGDATVVSLPKLFPCTLGGGLWTQDARILGRLAADYEALRERHRPHADEAFDRLLEIDFPDGAAAHPLEVEAVYGYLPSLVAFPEGALGRLPAGAEALRQDVVRRQRLWQMVREAFPGRTPVCEDSEVVPLAIPVGGDAAALRRVAEEISRAGDMETPVLHFDFARNMLEPDHRPAILIGCHEGWTEEVVDRVCALIADGLQ